MLVSVAPLLVSLQSKHLIFLITNFLGEKLHNYLLPRSSLPTLWRLRCIRSHRCTANHQSVRELTRYVLTDSLLVQSECPSVRFTSKSVAFSVVVVVERELLRLLSLAAWSLIHTDSLPQNEWQNITKPDHYLARSFIFITQVKVES